MAKRPEIRLAPPQLGGGLEAVVVVGGGGHAKVLISILKKAKTYLLLGYTDPNDNGPLLGAPYLGCDCELDRLAAARRRLSVVLGVGQVGLGKGRYELWKKLRSPALSFPLVVSPNAVVNESVSADEATVVMDGVVINTGATIGRGVIVNTNSTVEHDVVISDWVHIASGATIAGGVQIGRFSMIGAGATVIEGIKIGADCMVGAGATVVDDLTEPGIYVGNPARRIK